MSKESNSRNQSNPTINNAQNEMKEYISGTKELYGTLMQFLNNSDNNENYFQDLINIICLQKHAENCEQFEEFLQLIANVSNNYHREKSFFEKIFQILEHYEVQIKQTFSNKEIFYIFQSNKIILLFLFQKEIITIDENIYNELHNKIERNGNHYRHFFYPEIKKFIGEEKSKEILKELISIDSDILDHFEEKRKEGENDSFVCSLIREDSVEKFIECVNRANISLESEVKSSIFETNSFLIENESTTLIEYSAFFGSIQIFQYLRLNNVELKPSLWLYAIHSRNAELIHLLESLKVDPPNKGYKTCLFESIKCHHNEIADYIENNLMTGNNDKIIKSEEDLLSILSFHNYAYFPSVFDNSDEFYNLCNNNYHKLANLFIETKKEYIEKMISKGFSFKKAANKNEPEFIYYLLLSCNRVPDKCLYKNQQIKKVAIPSTVTSIEYAAFYLCRSLTHVTIPSSVTSIGGYAFRESESLTHVTVHSSVNSIKRDALKQITYSSSVNSIGEFAFYYCTSLTQVTIPPSITSIESHAFAKCFKLTQVTIPSSVTSIGEYAFDFCSSLPQITIPSSVTTIGECSFFDCLKLTQITIPSSVTSIGKYAFNGFSSLTEITILSSEISIGEGAFPSKAKIVRI